MEMGLRGYWVAQNLYCQIIPNSALIDLKCSHFMKELRLDLRTKKPTLASRFLCLENSDLVGETEDEMPKANQL